MDLSTIKPTTIEIAILHPATGEPTGLVLQAISPGDKAAAVARRRLQDRAQRKGATEADTVEFLAALVQSWTWGGESTWEDVKLEFNAANVKKVLSEPWVMAQVNAALGDDAAFFTK